MLWCYDQQLIAKDIFTILQLKEMRLHEQKVDFKPFLKFIIRNFNWNESKIVLLCVISAG